MNSGERRASTPPILGSLCLATVVACGGGEPPTIEDIADEEVAVGDELTIEIRATDPDGDALEYGFTTDVPHLDSRATITQTPAATGMFRWRPIAADVGLWYFDFTASDGEHTTTLTVAIDVQIAVGAATLPVFRRPLGPGTTLDLSLNSCLDLDILVEDQDSTAVTLDQAEPAIDGAVLEQTDDFAATWQWCPSREQIDAEERYTLTLSADDGDNPPVLKNYLVVLRQPAQQGCPNAAPVIEHTAADVSQIADLSLTATISDDFGLKGPPLLYYSPTPPAEPVDLGALQQVAMALTGGTTTAGQWTATIPNPVASQSAGASSTLYYLIVAGDDDDTTGSCDHETFGPMTGTYQMTITNPGGGGGLEVCESCSADTQCGDLDDHCVMLGATASCLRSCAAEVDCPSGYTCSATAVTSVDGATARQCVPDSGSCAPPAGCADDQYEDNDSRTQALERAPISTGTVLATSCPLEDGSNDDEDWFRFEISAETTVTLALVGDEVSNLELGLYDATGGRIESDTGAGSTESVSHCLTPGTYYARVYAWGAGVENHYQLTYARVDGTCALTCVDDEHEDDDDRARARDIEYPVFTSTGNQLCPDDDDYFAVYLRVGELVIVDLTFQQRSASEDLDIHLYDDQGADLTPCEPSDPNACDTGNGQSADSNEHFEFTADAEGFYYVVVRGWESSSNAYDVRIEAPK